MTDAHDPTPPLVQRFVTSVINPGRLVCYCYYYHFQTLLQWPLLAVTSFRSFRLRAFAKVWERLGASMSQALEGNTFDMLKTASDLITKAYGAEPAVGMHQTLQRNINKSGLAGKYDILSCGAEPSSLIPALHKHLRANNVEGDLNEGIFDTILCVRDLCSVPNQQETVNGLYGLLKPGGRLIVCEHIASPWPTRGSVIAWVLQKFWILAGWNLLMGGCKLNRDTVGALQAASAGGAYGWKQEDLVYWETWHPIPFVVGQLVKV